MGESLAQAVSDVIDLRLTRVPRKQADAKVIYILKEGDPPQRTKRQLSKGARRRLSQSGGELDRVTPFLSAWIDGASDLAIEFSHDDTPASDGHPIKVDGVEIQRIRKFDTREAFSRRLNEIGLEGQNCFDVAVWFVASVGLVVLVMTWWDPSHD